MARPRFPFLARLRQRPAGLRWTDHDSGFWSATGRTGTDWEIQWFPASERYGITVAHWDHPDWWAGTLEEAKRMAAEIDARPPIPPEEWIDEKPLVEYEGDQCEPWETQKRPLVDPCPDCGSAEEPEPVKPRKQTVQWWDDPSPYWRCPGCGSSRGDVPDSPYPESFSLGFMAPRLTSRFDAAVSFAREKHIVQVRKGTQIPYLAHLIAVAAIVLEGGGSEDHAIAALLHDVAEDQGGEEALAEIRVRFGDEVEEIVRSCSDTFAEAKPPWRARKEAYLAHLEDPATTEGALLVSLADKLHNAHAIVFDLRTEGEALWSRFSSPNGGADQLWYYRSLADAFTRRRPGALAEELDRTVTEMERLSGAET